MKRLSCLSLAALLAPAAFAGKAMKQLGMEEKGTPAGTARMIRTDPTACAKDAHCWKLVKIGFREILPSHTQTVDGALPNHYFRGCVTFALAGVSQTDGHFLYVRCEDPKNKKRRSDAGLRDALERRIVMATLVAALPLGQPVAELFNDRYELTPEGKAAFEGANAGRPGLWGELVDLTREALGVTDKGLPESLR